MLINIYAFIALKITILRKSASNSIKYEIKNQDIKK